MKLKKGWESKRINENCMGRYHFTRLYIKSPSGNFYLMYRSGSSDMLYLRTKELKEPLRLAEYEKRTYKGNDYMDVKRIFTFHEAIREIYKIEESGAYSKELSDEIKNIRECKLLFQSKDKAFRCNTCW